MTCGARLPVRPSLPRPKPTASAVRQNPSREVCPLSLQPIPHSWAQRRTRNTFTINYFRTLSYATEGVPISSSLALCFQQLPHSYCFPMLFPHTRGLYLYKSLRTAPAPTLSGRLCAIFFRFFHESETAGTNHQPLLCPHSFLPFSTLNLRSEIQILSELLTSFSAPSCNSRRMNTCKSGSK
jgi:hypothetical protein